jgi:hypothetical protein
MTDDKDELAALRKEVEALKSALSGKEDKPPPKKEFVEQPYQRYDPTAGMSMPLSTLREMAGHPCNQVMPGAIQDRHAPTGRPGMIPNQPTSSSRGSAGEGKGYVEPRPLGPPPGINWVDAQLIADEVRQRAELKRKLGG